MKKDAQTNTKIEVTKDGPYLVSGNLPLSEQWIVTNDEGDSLDYREGKKFPAQTQYALCRCGHSSNKPFCDGTHAKVRFDGAETASHQPYIEQAETIEGPTMNAYRSGKPLRLRTLLRPERQDLESGHARQPRSAGNCKTRGRPLSRRTIGRLGQKNRQTHRAEI
jgi:CDGSH-type Zn-finger protein